jgi:hypothetical protein
MDALASHRIGVKLAVDDGILDPLRLTDKE